MNETKRLFFAIEVPEDVKTELGKFGVTLERPWRPVKTEQMHITLAFMGEVPSSELERVMQVGEQAAAAVTEFSLEISDAAVFPESGEPKVLYAQADGGENLMALVDVLRTSLGALADQKKFKPHLTLARNRGERARKVIRRFRGNWPVQGFALFCSTLHENGPHHELLQRYQLKPVEKIMLAASEQD